MNALIFGAIASSALVLGALLGARIQLPKALLAAMLAFAAGALITALAFELFEDAYEHGGIWRAAVGLIVGAAVFTALSAWLDRAARRGTTAGAAPAGGNDVPEESHGSEKLDPDAAAQETGAGRRTALQQLTGDHLAAAGVRRRRGAGLARGHADAGGLREGRPAGRAEHDRRVRAVLRALHL